MITCPLEPTSFCLSFTYKLIYRWRPEISTENYFNMSGKDHLYSKNTRSSENQTIYNRFLQIFRSIFWMKFRLKSLQGNRKILTKCIRIRSICTHNSWRWDWESRKGTSRWYFDRRFILSRLLRLCLLCGQVKFASA